MKKILIYILIIAALVIAVLSIAVGRLHSDSTRYKKNQDALLSDVEYYKTENGKNAASVMKLTLTNSELKRNYADVCKTVDDLNIKLKRVQSVSVASTETDIRATTEVKDSTVYDKGVPVPVLAFEWKDPWTDIRGMIIKDSVDLNMQTRDTLIQVVHRVPHKFWFIKWGTKAIRQEIVSSNPHTRITYSEYIELKK